MSKTYVPENGRLLVRKVKQDQTTASGLIVAAANDGPQLAVIVGVNEGHYENGVFVSCKYEIGTQVFISRTAGLTMKLGGEDITLINETDVLVTIYED